MAGKKNSGVSWSLVTQCLTTQVALACGVFQVGVREASGCEDFHQKYRVSVLRFQSHSSQQHQKISSLQQKRSRNLRIILCLKFLHHLNLSYRSMGF